MIFALLPKAWAIDVTKSQYDLACTGANTLETVLTPSDVEYRDIRQAFYKNR